MAASDVNTAMAAAQSALASGDYATAIDSAIAAQGYLAELPDSTGAGGRLASALVWDAKKIEDFIANLRRREREAGASAGIQRSKIVHASTSASA